MNLREAKRTGIDVADHERDGNVDFPSVSNVTANDWADIGADEVQP
ncbi:MAG: hypothetical protein U1E76_05830 [Planctomycetota bacterium]